MVFVNFKTVIMSKKSINKKEVNKSIQEKVNQGISRTEILNELSEIYFDKKTLSLLIAAIPDPTRKEKYKLLNNVLLGLLLVTIFSKIIVGFSLLAQVSIGLTPFAILMPIINIYFALEVSKYKGYIYNILGLLTIAGILNTMTQLNESGLYGIADLIFGLLIAGLAFYLGNILFPNYGLRGTKKNRNGEIILD